MTELQQIDLGNYLVKSGKLTADQWQHVLKLKKEHDAPVPAILVSLRFLSEKDILRAWLFSVGKFRFGEILTGFDVVTEEEVQLALERQKKTGQKIGLVLLDMGFVDQSTLIRYISYQSEISSEALDAEISMADKFMDL
ncbi:MAG: hypothetical protein KDK38_02225 [Leptospiraceae bacterium]|nr:hypothetical protein [Leptospiraceae bacterium]